MKYLGAKNTINNKYYDIKSLDRLNPNSIILKHLCCENCGCKLTFHHSGKRKAYLATAPGHNHSSECRNKVYRKEAKERIRNKYAGTVTLTRTQQARLSMAGYLAMVKPDRKISANVKYSVSKTVTKKTVQTTSVSYRAVAGSSNGVIQVGNKNQKLHTRTPFVAPTNLYKYIGQAVKIGGTITKIIVGKGLVTIYFARDSVIFEVHLNEATFRNSAVGLSNSLRELNFKIQNKGFMALACAIVDVVPDSQGRPYCILRTEDGLNINGHPLRLALI